MFISTMAVICHGILTQEKFGTVINYNNVVNNISAQSSTYIDILQ